jgi:putative ABC transport system permease protein
MGSYSTVISKVGIAIFVVTNLIVILILYFVVNSSITRQKRTLGIQKAIGFTTFQLMNQVSLSFLIPVAVGVFIGSVLGITQTNDVMSVGESAMVYRKGRLYHYPELGLHCAA